jgi:hypothetical protein
LSAGRREQESGVAALSSRAGGEQGGREGERGSPSRDWVTANAGGEGGILERRRSGKERRAPAAWGRCCTARRHGQV